MGAAHAARGGRLERELPRLRASERGDRPLDVGPARLRLPGARRRQRRDPVDFGTDEQKERWLRPLVAGEMRSFFSMTEPEVPGSDPTTLRTRAVRDGDEWVIDGHKWFSSGAEGAAFGIVMAVTDPDADPHRRATPDHRSGRYAWGRGRASDPDDGTSRSRVDDALRGALHGCPRSGREHARRGGRRLPHRAEAPRPRPHPSRHALARPDAARVRAHVHVLARARVVRRAARREADRPELDRRLGRRDPGVPAHDARRGAQDRPGRRGAGRGLAHQVLRGARPARRDRPRGADARSARPHGRDAARGDARRWHAARGSTTARTRCTAWSSRDGSSSRSPPATAGASTEATGIVRRCSWSEPPWSWLSRWHWRSSSRNLAFRLRPAHDPRVGVRIAAAGDIACDPASRSSATGTAAASNAAARDLGSARRRGLRSRARARRHPVRGRCPRCVRGLLRRLVGTSEVDHETGSRQSRVPDGRCRRLLRVLRRGSGRSGEGLLQLRARGLARGRAQLELRGRGWLRRRLAAGALARADLAAHPARCTLAYWHHPRFSSGLHGSDRRTRRSGRRCTTRTPISSSSATTTTTSGSLRRRERGSISLRGIREFVVGTGGTEFGRSRGEAEQRGPRRDEPRRAGAHARRECLRVALPRRGRPFTDTGSAACH